MQETDKEFHNDLRKWILRKYAIILFNRYKRQKLPYSKHLIYKVACGQNINPTLQYLKIAHNHCIFALSGSDFINQTFC